MERYFFTASSKAGVLANPQHLNSGQKPRYTHSGTHADATSGSTLAISSTTSRHAARVSGEACEHSLRRDMNITVCALAKHSCSTGASCRAPVRSSPVRSVRWVETKCSIPNLCLTKCTDTQYGRFVHFQEKMSFRIGECSERRIVFFHLEDGSFVPSGIRIVVRAASATLRHEPSTLRNFNAVLFMGLDYTICGSFCHSGLTKRQKEMKGFKISALFASLKKYIQHNCERFDFLIKFSPFKFWHRCHS